MKSNIYINYATILLLKFNEHLDLVHLLLKICSSGNINNAESAEDKFACMFESQIAIATVNKVCSQ